MLQELAQIQEIKNFSSYCFGAHGPQDMLLVISDNLANFFHFKGLFSNKFALF